MLECMEGNPLKGTEHKKAENAPMPMDARVTEFAADYEAPLKEQVAIMKDAKDLLEKIQHAPGLKPEAISKIITAQTARFMAAKTELAKLQAENEARLKRHMQ